MNRTLSTLNSGLIWAGAGISASAIVVGTWIAPLGWQQGLLAIVLGHLLGGILFCCRLNWGENRQKCDANGANFLWQRLGVFLPCQCATACWLDSHYDLYRGRDQ